jgi:hypothetical protein
MQVLLLLSCMSNDYSKHLILYSNHDPGVCGNQLNMLKKYNTRNPWVPILNSNIIKVLHGSIIAKWDSIIDLLRGNLFLPR